MPKQKFYSNLYVQVLAGIALGVLFGFVDPGRAAAMKPLGDGFIKLVKMLIAPIVFTTVVVGIAHMGAMKDVGRIGLRALVYFEVVSTIALIIGLIVVNVLQPGRGVGFDPATADLSEVAPIRGSVESTQLSEARAITNLIGNAVATMVVAKWDGAIDLERARRILDGEPPVEVEEVLVELRILNS